MNKKKKINQLKFKRVKMLRIYNNWEKMKIKQILKIVLQIQVLNYDNLNKK